EGDAEVHQRPGGVLARRAAAEIVIRNEDLGFAISRLVEDEIGVLAAVIPVALLREQPLAEAGALDGLEILLRDDRVGIHIDHSQRCGDAFKGGELLHFARVYVCKIVVVTLSAIVSLRKVSSRIRPRFIQPMVVLSY